MRRGEVLHSKIRTFPSGKRERITFNLAGRIIETKPLSRAKITRTKRRLNRRRRRIGL